MGQQDNVDKDNINQEQEEETGLPETDAPSPVALERVVELLRGADGRPVPLREIWQEFQVGPDDRAGLRAMLADAVDQGVLERLPGRKFVLKEVRQPQEVVGVVHRHEKGYAWLLGTGVKVGKGGDPFIPPEELDGVMHGDRVRARLLPGREGRPRAMVMEVLDRQKQCVGTVRLRGRRAFVELGVGLDLMVLENAEQLTRADNGVAATVEVLERATRERAGRARLVEVLGRAGEVSVELSRILLESGVPQQFGPEVLHEVEARSDNIEEEGRQDRHRRDITHLPLVTIDGEDARDFDDAVCVEQVGGKRLLTVAIADVSHYVRPGTPLDDEAALRGTSIYLPDRVIPMLPHRLSSGLCTLTPHEKRLCVVAQMLFGSGPTPERVEFFTGIMRSVARLTYTRVAEAMDAGEDRLVEAPGFDLRAATALYRQLRAARADRGALDLDLPEIDVHLDAHGEPEELVQVVRHDSHRLIEEFMIAANEAVANRLADADWPCIYRIHDQPNPEKLERFRAIANAHAVAHRLPPDPSPKQLAVFLDELKDHPAARTLQTMLLRSLMQARYQVDNAGHYGLASTAYLHFTSPIRRYPDLLVHRQLKALLAFERGEGRPAHPEDEKRLQKAAESSTSSERKAVELERAVHALYAARMCQKHLGEVFAASVTACTEMGLFVQLQPLWAEGLIPMALLGGDRFELDDLSATLFSRRSGQSFRPGDTVWARIVDVNMLRRLVTLERAEQPEQADQPVHAAGEEEQEPARKTKRPAKRKEPVKAARGKGSTSKRPSTRAAKGSGTRKKPAARKPAKKSPTRARKTTTRKGGKAKSGTKRRTRT